MSNRLFKILDGIVAESYDYTEETLVETFKKSREALTGMSVEQVIAYAEACDEIISSDEALKIIRVGKHWLSEQENGNGEWSRMRGEAIKALEE